MTSYRAMPRVKLEAMEQQISTDLASIKATVEAIRTEMQERLRVPLQRQEALAADLALIRLELEDRRKRDAMVPTVTDHALLRYIERVHGVDIEAIRAAILTPVVVTAIKNGAAAVRSDECRYTIKDMSVVTVYVEEKRSTARKPTRAMRERLEYDGAAE